MTYICRHVDKGRRIRAKVGTIPAMVAIRQTFYKVGDTVVWTDDLCRGWGCNRPLVGAHWQTGTVTDINDAAVFISKSHYIVPS